MEALKSSRAALVAAALGVAVLALGAAAYFYFYAPQSASETPTAEETPALNIGPDVGAEISGAVETPAEKLPETNPFTGYKNPFD